jgi:hypothetical protein
MIIVRKSDLATVRPDVFFYSGTLRNWFAYIMYLSVITSRHYERGASTTAITITIV